MLGYALVATTLIGALDAQKKKKGEEEEPPTQTLEIPKDPPQAVTADTAALVFHVSGLSAKGLLSQQTRDAIKDLQKKVRGATIVKLRAFVAGSGDLRRVQAIVSETFTEKRLPLPALTVVQVGGLTLTGAQVVLESMSVSRRPVNPHGLAFISGQQAGEDGPLAPIAPLLDKSLSDVKTAAAGAGLAPEDILRVTCLVTLFEKPGEAQARIAAAFPKAAVNYVQTQRAATRTVAECEAFARLKTPPGEPAKLLNPDSLPKSPNYSQVVLIGAPKVAISGAQLAFHAQEQDIRLAFQRLGKALETVGGKVPATAISQIYPLSQSVLEKVRALRFEFYDKARPPASTMLLFEGLPSLDASFAVDVIAPL